MKDATEPNVPMEDVSELSSELVDYIWFNIQHHHWEYSHTIELENGDFGYRDEAQDIYIQVLDIVDRTLNPIKEDE